MTPFTLPALFVGLLPFTGRIDFSSLPISGSIKEIWQQLDQILSPTQVRQVQSAKNLALDVRFVTIVDSDYPESLRQLPYAPPVLFYMGDLHLLSQSNFAIIGSRNTSRDSQRFTSQLAWSAQFTQNIVTGLSYGIEEYALKSVLNKRRMSSSIAPTQVIAVLEKGFDTVRGERESWMNTLCEQGGLVISPYLPDQMLQKWHYAYRNTLIAAISDAIVLVEASKTSGSLKTVYTGLELGKEIYAVPHHPNRLNGRGCLAILEQGATPLLSPNQLFDIPEMPALLDLLDNPISLQELASFRQEEPAILLESLLDLKEQGFIQQRGALWERI